MYTKMCVDLSESIDFALDEPWLFPRRKFNYETDFNEDLTEEEQKERLIGIANAKQDLLRWVDEHGMATVTFDTETGTAALEERAQQPKDKEPYGVHLIVYVYLGSSVYPALGRWVDEEGLATVEINTVAGTAIVDERVQPIKKGTYAI